MVLPFELSVAELPVQLDGRHGGPTVPVWIVYVVLNPPLADVPTSFDSGFVQPIGMGFPRNMTVGWLLSVLHCNMAPGWFGVNPEPVTVTVVPLTMQLPGSIVTVAPPDVTVAGAGLQGAVVVVVGGSVEVVVVVVVVFFVLAAVIAPDFAAG